MHNYNDNTPNADETCYAASNDNNCDNDIDNDNNRENIEREVIKHLRLRN